MEAVKAETARKRKIKEDLRAGKKERGQATVANLEKLREGARDYAIQKQAFGQKGRQFGIEQANARREGAANRAQDEAASRRTAQNNVRSNAQDERASERSAKGGGLTSAERRNQKEARQDAGSAVRRTIKANGVPKSAQEWAGLEAIVAKESGVGSRRAAQAVKHYKRHALPKQRRKEAVKKLAPGF